MEAISSSPAPPPTPASASTLYRNSLLRRTRVVDASQIFYVLFHESDFLPIDEFDDNDDDQQGRSGFTNARSTKVVLPPGEKRSKLKLNLSKTLIKSGYAMVGYHCFLNLFSLEGTENSVMKQTNSVLSAKSKYP